MGFSSPVARSVAFLAVSSDKLFSFGFPSVPALPSPVATCAAFLAGTFFSHRKRLLWISRWAGAGWAAGGGQAVAPRLLSRTAGD